MATGHLGVPVHEGSRALGELCNNPLNLMGGGAFQGKVGVYKAPNGGYYVFAPLNGAPGWVMGMRGAFVDWNTKHRRMGGLTIEKLILAWAPAGAHENDPEGYIQSVCRFTGLDPDHGIVRGDKLTDCAVMKAMITVECGRCIYSDADIEMAWDLAHGVKQELPIPATKIGKGNVVNALGGIGTLTTAVVATQDQVRQAAGIDGFVKWLLIGLAILSLIGAGIVWWGQRQNRQEPT